jgi:hypothetical protein
MIRIALLTAIVAASLGLAALLFLRTLTTAAGATPEDRAIAMGLLLENPVPVATVDEGLRVADGLRRRYGLDSGNIHADRVTAALWARDEVVAQLDVTPEQLQTAAEALGYSLDPGRCGNTCENVARLARIELEKRALVGFATAAAR